MKTRQILPVLAGLSLLLGATAYANDRGDGAPGADRPMMGQSCNGMSPGDAPRGRGDMPPAQGKGKGHHGGMGGPGMDMPPGGAPGMERMAMISRLDLSDEQMDKLEAIHDRLHEKHLGMLQKQWEAERKLKAAYDKTSADPAEVGKAYMAQAELQRQMLEARVAAENDMMALLTTEQKASLAKQRPRRMHW